MDSLLKLFEGFWHSLQSGQVPNLGFWTYALLALFVAIEGPISTLLGAAAASAGWMRPHLVFVAASIGNLGADSLWYLLGYSGRSEWVVRHGRWLGIRRRHLDKLRGLIITYAPKILFVAKVTAAFIIPSLIAAGLARVRWRRWFPPLLAGEVIWTGALVLIGYYATEMINRVGRDIQYLAVIGTVVFLVMLAWLVPRALKQSQELNNSKHSDGDS
jgi:membrane protein DedA with SNARE-associated domain